MTYEQLSWLHLATIVPAFLLGTFLLLRRKGTPTHKLLGRVYLLLMIATGARHIDDVIPFTIEQA